MTICCYSVLRPPGVLPLGGHTVLPLVRCSALLLSGSTVLLVQLLHAAIFLCWAQGVINWWQLQHLLLLLMMIMMMMIMIMIMMIMMIMISPCTATLAVALLTMV
jgi:hypothetical protein